GGVSTKKAVPAVELEALAGEAFLERGRPPLRHRRLHHDVLAAHVGGERLIHEGLPDLDLGRELRERELRVLEPGDRLAERFTLLHVRDRVGERSAAGRERDGADREALLLEIRHEHLEAMPLAAEEVRRRDAAVLEGELARVLGVEPELLEFPSAHEAWRARLDEDQ